MKSWLAVLGGVITVAIGLALHLHFGPEATLCNSGFGAVGQAFSGTVATDCSMVTTLAGAATFVLIIGGLLVLLGIIGVYGGSRPGRHGSGGGGWQQIDREG